MPYEESLCRTDLALINSNSDGLFVLNIQQATVFLSNHWLLVAWLVNKSNNSCGTVVSSDHEKFTMDKNQISSNKLFQISAGVDLEKFSPGESTGQLRLIYHGRLDKHRGVLALPMLVRKAITAGLDISLKLIGDGDCFSDLQKIASDFDEITVFPTMSTEEVANHLRESDVGILPMPEIDMWAISSPLKYINI